jgi:Sap, sulfolipid-1-addressing protein
MPVPMFTSVRGRTDRPGHRRVAADGGRGRAQPDPDHRGRADADHAYPIFALIGTAGVGTPVVIYLTLGERSQQLLARFKDWMSRHDAVIMSGLCLVIGAKLIGDAVGALT